jgi:hypothetical protein
VPWTLRRPRHFRQIVGTKLVLVLDFEGVSRVGGHSRAGGGEDPAHPERDRVGAGCGERPVGVGV